MSAVTAWLKRHKIDLLVAGLLVALTIIVGGANMAGYPQRFEDEGTYVSQAFAVEKRHALTHYTYWYDHPPVGWIQIAGYTTLTRAFERNNSAISAGREFMLVLHVITVGLIYAIARRLKLGILAAGIGVLLYALSPLTIEFSRYVLLDNVALPWLLGAFLLALSPRRSLTTAVGSAVCMAIAILSKETLLVLLPILLYTIWQTSDKRNRRYTMTAFSVIFVMLSASYILYAALKSELIPGAGHVSLLGTLYFQLFSRAGSGSILNAHSSAYGLANYWLSIDPWLLAAGVVALPVSLWVKQLRPVGFSLLLGLLLLLRSGYLPYPYVIALLPFAGLTLAAGLQYLVWLPARLKPISVKARSIATAALLLSLGLEAAFTIFVAPAWQSKIQTLLIVDNDASSRQAVDWINQNIGRENRLVVESALWTDLQSKGFDKPQPVWLYKTETDPEVTKSLGGWQGIDYIVLDGPTISQNSAHNFPTVYTAIANSKIAAEFGTNSQKIVVYKVNHQPKNLP